MSGWTGGGEREGVWRGEEGERGGVEGGGEREGVGEGVGEWPLKKKKTLQVYFSEHEVLDSVLVE